MQTTKKQDQSVNNLVTLYRPLGLKALVAATLMQKVGKAPDTPVAANLSELK